MTKKDNDKSAEIAFLGDKLMERLSWERNASLWVHTCATEMDVRVEDGVAQRCLTYDIFLSQLDLCWRCPAPGRELPKGRDWIAPRVYRGLEKHSAPLELVFASIISYVLVNSFWTSRAVGGGERWNRRGEKLISFRGH